MAPSSYERLMVHRGKFISQISSQREQIASRPATPAPAPAALHDQLDITVCTRCRPILPFDPPAEFEVLSHTPTDTYVHLPTLAVDGITPKLSTSKFGVDHAFGPSDDNALVSAAVCPPLVDLATSGGFACILAYGQTGTGKTFTLLSPASDSGITDTLAPGLFAAAQAKQDPAAPMEFYAGYFELLGDRAVDLLSGEEVFIREDALGDVQVRGLTERRVHTPCELLAIARRASEHRTAAATERNAASSRSHGVLRIRVTNPSLVSAEDGVLLVLDLAGSETLNDSKGHSAERLEETKAINTSLMALKDCIRGRALAAMEPSRHHHVPYRSSRLTLLLKNAFEMSSVRRVALTIFACVSPLAVDAQHSLRTLRFITPLKVTARAAKTTQPGPVDRRNPANWPPEVLARWVAEKTSGIVDPAVLCPDMSGRQLLRLPEHDFIRRCVACGLGEKRSRELYTKLFSLMVDRRDADRKRQRQDQLAEARAQRARDEAEFAAELERRVRAGV
jgi:kinesin family protein 2/24